MLAGRACADRSAFSGPGQFKGRATHDSARSLGHLTSLNTTVAWGQGDAEASNSQTQHDLARPEKVSDLRRAEQLELRKPGGILVRSCEPRILKLEGVVPELLAGLAQEPLRAQPVQGREQSAEDARAPHGNQLVVLRRDPGRQDVVDALVVTAAPLHEYGIGEIVAVDDGQQGLRQVVVDMGVDAEQDVTQRGQVRCCRERQGRGTSPPASSSVSSAAKHSSAKMTSQRSTHSGSSKEAAAIASATAWVVRW